MRYDLRRKFESLRRAAWSMPFEPDPLSEDAAGLAVKGINLLGEAFEDRTGQPPDWTDPAFLGWAEDAAPLFTGWLFDGCQGPPPPTSCLDSIRRPARAS